MNRLTSFFAGTFYLLFWYLYMLLLPFNQIQVNYSKVINSPNWYFVNIFQIIALLSFILFFNNVKSKIYSEGITAKVMVVFQNIGFFCLVGLAYSETILYPIIAKEAPDLLNLSNGKIYTNIIVMCVSISSVLLFMVSNIYFGIKLRKYFPVLGIVFGIGMTIFLLGFAVGNVRYIIQTCGLTIYCISLIIMGIRKTNNF